MSQVKPPALDTDLPAQPDGQDQEVVRLRDLSPQQWKSGLAAWLGWLFDGLDMHLYTVVASPFVAQLLVVRETDESVSYYCTLIQAAFLVGWALGGGFFGVIGDRLGRSRALMLTILTYAICTGLSFLAQEWWHLFIFRFLAALGIGGEWAVGASLLSETWPKRWRPWLAAVLQTGVNLGVLLGMVAGVLMAGFDEPRYIFLVGILPALLVLWIRRAVPETEEWHQARRASAHRTPSVLKLFQGNVRRITVLTLLVCALTLTPHWAVTFLSMLHLGYLPDVQGWTNGEKQQLKSVAFGLLMVGAIAGNYLAAWMATRIGYRNAIALISFAYFATTVAFYWIPQNHVSLIYFMPLLGLCQGIFALFTMYLPPLFPTLLRTTGAGFCYNIGRIAAAAGTVLFGLFQAAGDYRLAMIYAGIVFIPAGVISFLLPEPPDEKPGAAPEHTIPREIPAPTPGPID